MDALIKGGVVQQYPYSILELRRAHPNASIPDTPEAKAAFDVFPVMPVERPEYDPRTHVLSSGTPVVINGEWTESWIVRDKTEAELLSEIPWQTPIEARKAVVQWINGLTAQIEELYPSAVQKRWEIEEAAARAVKVNDGSATADQIALVTREGAAKGRTPEEHADAIIANAIRFRAIADQTNTLFLATDAQLQAAQSPLEYPAIFDWAKQQAAPLAAEYGLQV